VGLAAHSQPQRRLDVQRRRRQARRETWREFAALFGGMAVLYLIFWMLATVVER